MVTGRRGDSKAKTEINGKQRTGSLFENKQSELSQLYRLKQASPWRGNHQAAYRSPADADIC